MTKQIKLIVFSIIGLIICCYLVHNNKIEFSHISGFYTEEFYLEINAPTGDIYYTLDGSEPDRSSFLYTEPINIVDASYNDNVYSARTDLSTAFLEEIDSDAYANVYTVPDFLVDKATIVRAVYYDIFGTKSEIITGTYFVDFETKTGYEDYNTISIVTNPDNLFGYDEWIYVL